MLSSPIPITPDFVHRAHSMIQERVTKTPVLTSKALSNMATLQVRPEEPLQKLRSPVELYFKCENMQKTGSFKFRGALNSVVSMSDEQLKRGLVTTSSGTTSCKNTLRNGTCSDLQQGITERPLERLHMSWLTRRVLQSQSTLSCPTTRWLEKSLPPRTAVLQSSVLGQHGRSVMRF
jgi:hypothetical protein